MEGFSFVTPVTGLNRPNTGKEDDDDLKKMGWESVDWIHLAQCRNCWRALVNTAVNLIFP
jgi:hypothetical protein